MSDPLTPIAADIEALIKNSVRESMQPFGLRDVRVRAGEDHDGDPVIFVEVDYDLSETPIDSQVTAQLTTTLQDRLAEHGERRFAHVRHAFDERQQVQQVKPRRRAKA